MSTGDESLLGQVAIVSGGAGDIGQAIARVLVERGAKVALADLQPQSSLPSELVTDHYTQLDVTDPSAVDHWLVRVEHDLGLPTLIVPNAAIVEPAHSLEVTVDSWRRTMEVNLFGAFCMAQQAARKLVAARYTGRVIFIGSWAAHAPHPQIVAYCVAKAGLRMAMQCLALELAPHGIPVNEVAPGKVDAGLSRRIFDHTPGLRERASSEIPSGALLQAADVANSVAYLCRPDTRQMTGSVLLVDGGLSLVRPV